MPPMVTVVPRAIETKVIERGHTLDEVLPTLDAMMPVLIPAYPLVLGYDRRHNE